MPSKSLAVKYRPKILRSVVGQDSAKKIVSNILKNAIDNLDIPGTILITGDTGLGKTTFGRIIARSLNCKEGTGCGECKSCILFDTRSENHPDFYEENTANARGIDDVRSIAEITKYKPLYKVRVILLDEAHQMTPQAGQALLKYLEEPSPQTIFILATTNPEKLPKAMHNRGVRLHLTPVPIEDLAKRLFTIAKKEKTPVSKEISMQLAEYSGGRVRDAIVTLERLIAIVKETGKTPSKKSIKQAFELDEGMELSLSTSRVLLGIYEAKPLEVMLGLAEINDFNTFVTKATYMNGFVMYAILQHRGEKVSNPYFGNYENRRIFDALKPDLKDKKILQRAIQTTARLKVLQSALFTPGMVDARSCAISCLALNHDSI